MQRKLLARCVYLSWGNFLSYFYMQAACILLMADLTAIVKW